MTERQCFEFTNGWASTMTMCVCGDVFSASGKPDDVRSQERAWNAEHANCTPIQRDGEKVFWLSFCDNDKPKGTQFLGACLIRVSAADADEEDMTLMLRFPMHQPGAEWLAAAIAKSHRLQCNPGGEVASWELPSDAPQLAHYPFDTLFDRLTIERIDAEIDASSRVDSRGESD